MTEKKTFKNPAMNWTYDTLLRKYGWFVEDQLGFYADEWDMEVTFTKKPKEIKEGAWVYHQPSGSVFHDEVFVLAIKGAWAWVTSSPDGLDSGDFHPDMVVPLASLS